jgi:hypothetical protein
LALEHAVDREGRSFLERGLGGADVEDALGRAQAERVLAAADEGGDVMLRAIG